MSRRPETGVPLPCRARLETPRSRSQVPPVCCGNPWLSRRSRSFCCSTTHVRPSGEFNDDAHPVTASTASDGSSHENAFLTLAPSMVILLINPSGERVTPLPSALSIGTTALRENDHCVTASASLFLCCAARVRRTSTTRHHRTGAPASPMVWLVQRRHMRLRGCPDHVVKGAPNGASAEPRHLRSCVGPCSTTSAWGG